MKIKSKIYLIILTGFLMGVVGFFFITKSLGDHYYIYRKKQFLRKQERFIEDGSFRQVKTVSVDEIDLKEDQGPFNAEVRKKVFQEKIPWQYNIWFSKEDLIHIGKGYSVTRIFYQEDLNLAFLIRIIEYEGRYYALKTNIPSVSENFYFARELNTITFIVIALFLSSVLLIYSRSLTRKINIIKSNLNYIEEKEFHKVEVIDSNDEIEEISRLICHVARETEKNLLSLENKAEEQKEFLRNFGHEIKTPLTIANGYTDILKTQYPENPHLGIISKELIRISKITRKFQDFSSGRKELFFEDIPVKELTGIGNIFSRKYKKIGYHESFNECDSHLVRCDIELIESLFYNLYSNAFNYCRSAVWTTLNAEENLLMIEVGNDCETIREEELKKIWQPFYKINNNSNGTGLGLSIVRDIVSKHGWKIEAHSAEDTVRFILEIPLEN